MRLSHFLVPMALSALCLVAAGCGGNSNSNSYTTYTSSVTGTLQGELIDATTGLPITLDLTSKDTKDSFILIQGTNERAPNKLNTTSGVAGEYAFTNIPVTAGWVNGQPSSPTAEFKIVINKAGYQPFEAEFAFSGNYAVTSSGVMADAVYNKIGNIYLFPMGSTAADYPVTVKYNNKAVSGATVELVQLAGNNNAAISASIQAGATNFGLSDGFNSNRLLPSSGLYPVLTGTTDDKGVATFASAQLVLGGQYAVVVLPGKPSNANDANVPLLRTDGVTFTEGTAAVGQVIVQKDGTVAANQAGLFVASASNQTAGVLSADGSLTITFNRPVTLNNATSVGLGFDASVTRDNPSATASTVASLNANSQNTRTVTATLASNGLSLVLTPSWFQTPASSDFDLQITYVDGTATVSPVGQPELTFGIFSQLKLADGSAVSGAVNINGPQQ